MAIASYELTQNQDSKIPLDQLYQFIFGAMGTSRYEHSIALSSGCGYEVRRVGLAQYNGLIWTQSGHRIMR